MFVEEDYGSIKILISENCSKGVIVPLGKSQWPGNWLNMTQEEQIEWAIQHASAIVMHPDTKWRLKDIIDRIRL